MRDEIVKDRRERETADEDTKIQTRTDRTSSSERLLG
jgi:hypothetical protein